jgi:transposase
MPLATVLSLRLALDRMVRTGATASDIARHLGLSSSTVRGLMQRVRQAGPDRTPDALQPRYEACGPRPLEAPPLLEATLALRRQHPRWGGGRIRVELSKLNPATVLPSVRTMQRWLLEHGLAPAPPGRRRATAWQRAQHPHDIWEIDAADQKRLADGQLISWLRVVDECTGAALQSRVFPPRLLRPGAFWNGAGRTPPLLQTLGTTSIGASGQRQSLGIVWRPADAVGAVADRPGHRRDLESAAAAAGQRRGGAEPRRGLELGRAGPVP